jgi:tetratricopeptide (TPR) repeat protein
MKAFFLGTASLGIAFAAAPAGSSVVSVGGPLSILCYKAADRLDASKDAINNCTRSVNEEAMAPHDLAATYVNRGILYMLQNDRTAAESDFNRSLAIDPSVTDATLNKAFLRLKEKRSAEALALLNDSLKVGVRRPALAYFARGLANEDLGDLSAAYADYQRARDLEPAWSLPGQYLARYDLRSR